MQPKYTAAQWEAYLPAFRDLAMGTVQMAKAVLVDGQKPSQVAKETGDSRQLVYAAVKRVRTILEKHDVQELVPVLVWLPPELAEQVRQMAAPYQQPKTKD